MRRYALACFVSTLLALAALPTMAKPPFEFRCPAEDEVEVSYCCPEDPAEAVDGARLAAATVCVRRGMQYYEVLEENQVVDSTPVSSAQVSFEKLMVTARLKVRLHAHDAQGALFCSDRYEAAQGDKKQRKLLGKIEKLLKTQPDDC